MVDMRRGAHMKREGDQHVNALKGDTRAVTGGTGGM